MCEKTFPVTRYVVDLEARTRLILPGGPLDVQGYLVCFGGEGCRLVVYGVGSADALPTPTCDPVARVGTLFVPVEELITYVGLARAHAPLYAHINLEHPEWTALTTRQRPLAWHAHT